MTAAELGDALNILNDMLDSWSAKRATVFVTPRVTTDQNNVALALIPNKQSYVLGNVNGNEDFLLARPARKPRVSISYLASSQAPVEYPMIMYDDVQWQGIANKNTQSILPQVCYIETGFADMQLNFWPIPTQANPVILYVWQALTQFPDLITKFTFPPGYARAIRFNLAIELFAEFSGDPTKVQVIAAVATKALATIESLNVSGKEAYVDAALLGTQRPRGNIFTSTATRTHP